MKKFIIILLVIAFFSGCTKYEIEPMVTKPVVKDIFSVSQSNVTDGQPFEFFLPSTEFYTLTLVDTLTNQVISKEKIQGVAGLNSANIYTKTIQSKYLYLILLDANSNQIAKTTIIIK